MSRCFPFPPPGFVLPNATLIESIEQLKKTKKEKKEKKKEKEDKKRKSETTTDKTPGREHKKHKDKKRKRDEKSKIDQKDGNNPSNNGEGSGTTEEQGLPAVQFTCISRDESQNSSKRRKVESMDDVRNGQAVQFACISRNESQISSKQSKVENIDEVRTGQGLPAVQFACIPPDESQSSSKRRKVENMDDVRNEQGAANGLRIRLPLGKLKGTPSPGSTKVEDQCISSMMGHEVAARQLHTALFSNQQPTTIGKQVFQPLDDGHLDCLASKHFNSPESIRCTESYIQSVGQPQTQAQTQTHTGLIRLSNHGAVAAFQPRPPSNISKRSERSGTPTTKQPQIPPASATLSNVSKRPERCAPPIKQPQIPPAAGRQAEPHVAATRKSSHSSIVLNQAGITLESKQLKEISAARKDPKVPYVATKLDIPPAVGKQPVIRQPNHPAIVHNQAVNPLKSVKQTKEIIATAEDPTGLGLKAPSVSKKKQSSPNVKHTIPHQKDVQACFSGRTDSSLTRQEQELPFPRGSHLEIKVADDAPCFSGRTEAAHCSKDNMPPKKPKPPLGFQGSKSSRRDEAILRDIMTHWDPPLLHQYTDEQDLDWLFAPKSKLCIPGTGCGLDNKPPLSEEFTLSPTWPPKATCLPQGNGYALPYVIPF